MHRLFLKKWGQTITTLIFLLLFSSVVSIAYGAEQYEPLVGIPGLTNDSTRDLGSFFNTAYVVLISLGALAAVVKIAIAGFKYSLSDIVTSKSEAKSDIYGALLGLAILLIPYIVLNEINPNLTSIDVLKGAVPLNLTATQTGTPTPGQNVQALNQQLANDCAPAPGKQLGPACPQGGITPTTAAAANSCTGFFDYQIKTCFSANSSYVYNTSVGAGTFNSRTVTGWETMCTAAGKKLDTVQSATDTNVYTYSCK